jgi:hypothetical protein
MPLNMLIQIIKHSLIDMGLGHFLNDWQTIPGEFWPF